MRSWPQYLPLTIARALALVGCFSVFLLPQVQAQSYKVLIFSATAGFRHDSIPTGIATIRLFISLPLR